MDAINRKTTNARIDSALVEQFQDDIAYWAQVLLRIVDVLKLLCQRGLSIRGKDSVIGSAQNGNYLGILELLSKYDPFLKNHIAKYANKGPGHTSYLSHKIADEIIAIMAKKVHDNITEEVICAKYFSISVDSTPDISHIDQLSVTIRYILPNSEPVQRFLCFIPINSHKGQPIADVVLVFLQEHHNSVTGECDG